MVRKLLTSVAWPMAGYAAAAGWLAASLPEPGLPFTERLLLVEGIAPWAAAAMASVATAVAVRLALGRALDLARAEALGGEVELSARGARPQAFGLDPGERLLAVVEGARPRNSVEAVADVVASAGLVWCLVTGFATWLLAMAPDPLTAERAGLLLVVGLPVAGLAMVRAGSDTAETLAYPIAAALLPLALLAGTGPEFLQWCAERGLVLVPILTGLAGLAALFRKAHRPTALLLSDRGLVWVLDGRPGTRVRPVRWASGPSGWRFEDETGAALEVEPRATTDRELAAGLAAAGFAVQRVPGGGPAIRWPVVRLALGLVLLAVSAQLARDGRDLAADLVSGDGFGTLFERASEDPAAARALRDRAAAKAAAHPDRAYLVAVQWYAALLEVDLAASRAHRDRAEALAAKAWVPVVFAASRMARNLERLSERTVALERLLGPAPRGWEPADESTRAFRLALADQTGYPVGLPPGAETRVLLEAVREMAPDAPGPLLVSAWLEFGSWTWEPVGSRDRLDDFLTVLGEGRRKSERVRKSLEPLADLGPWREVRDRFEELLPAEVRARLLVALQADLAAGLSLERWRPVLESISRSRFAAWVPALSADVYDARGAVQPGAAIHPLQRALLDPPADADGALAALPEIREAMGGVVWASLLAQRREDAAKVLEAAIARDPVAGRRLAAAQVP